MTSEMEYLRYQNYKMRKIIKNTFWMARCWAGENNLFAPYLFNQSVDLAIQCKLPVQKKYCNDKIYGKWNSCYRKFKYQF